jgi:DNA polymerase-3 subunit delta'
MQFKNIIGQNIIKNRLIQSVQHGRISHAQLFLGAEGSGALPLAIAYAQYINCLQPTSDDACGLCNSCVKYEKLQHPDLHFSFPLVRTDKKKICDDYYPEWNQALLADPYITSFKWILTQDDEGKKQGNIPAEECRQVIKKLGLKAFEAKYKTLIIWLPEHLGYEGNILLKMLEEPAPNTLLILVAEDAEKILGTILSRTQMLKIPRLSDEDVMADLLANHELAQRDAEPIARISEGNLAVARQLAAEGVSNFHQVFTKWARAMYKAELDEIGTYIESVLQSGKEFTKQFLHYSMQMMRAVMLSKFASQSMIRLSEDELNFVNKFQVVFNANNLHEIIAEFNKSIYELERNGDARIIFYNLSFYISRRLVRTKQ